MKLAFIDAEFTGEHARATLVSVAVVGMGGEELHVTLSDYDRDQVTPWLEQHVLAHIDESQSVSGAEAFRRAEEWFDRYSEGEPVHLVSAGKMLDLILLFELWHHAHPDWEYFHHLHGLPSCLNHASHLDLPTVFVLAGKDPNIERSTFGGGGLEGDRHEALYDARVVRACFLKLRDSGAFPRLDEAD